MNIPWLPNQQVPLVLRRALEQAADFRVPVTPEPNRLAPGKLGYYQGSLYLGVNGKPALLIGPVGGGGQTTKDPDRPGGIPVGSHDPVTLGAGSDAALALSGQQLTLADVLTPTEHTAIGNSAPHHAEAHVLDSHTDVDASAPNDDDVLTYDSGSGNWIPEPFTPPSAGALDELTDVNATSPADNDCLTFDTASGEWIPEQRVDLTGNQTVAGIKTLTSIPVLPASDPTSANQAVRKAYVDAIAVGLTWKNAVIDKDLATPPGSPTTGDRYMVATGGAGAWAGLDGQLVEYNGAAWVSDGAPAAGWAVLTIDDSKQWVYTGSAWVQLSAGVAYLDDLADVNAPAPANLQVLTYNSATGQWVAAASAGGGGTLAIFDVDVMSDPGTARVWTNMPAAVTELFGNTYSRVKVDLTAATQYRLQVVQSVAGFSTADLNLQYSTDNVTYAAADTAAAGEVAVGAGTGVKVGAWATIVTGAKADVRLRIVGKQGNGTVDPAFRQIRVQFKVGGAGADELVKVSSDDTTAGYLGTKLVAGSGITLTEVGGGGNETLSVATTGTTTDEKLKVSANDTTADYLAAKLTVAGGATSAVAPEGGNEVQTITVHAAVTLGAGSDAALGLSGQELTLADVLTPTEHTAIGNGAPHHAEDHDHDGSPTQKLAQANTHESADTDSAQASIHHTVDGSTTPTALDGSGAAGTAKKPSPADHKHADSARHAQSHVLADSSALGTDHTVSGLTTGHVLTALSATTAAFQAAGVGAAHDLLSGAHLDATAAAAVRGDIISAQGASPLWTRLAVGATGTYLAGGTEPAWATLNQAAIAGLTTASSPQFAALGLGVAASASWEINVLSGATTYGVNMQRSAADALGPIINTLKSRGTSESPAAISQYDTLLEIRVGGYGASAWGSNKGGLRFMSSEAWTNAAMGTLVDFLLTPALSTTAAQRAVMWHGGLGVLGGIRIGSVTAAPAAANYYSSDGTAGGSGTISVADTGTIVVKNGLITTWSA